MVYLKHWNEFKAQALELYSRNPRQSRFLVKAQPKTQTLVVKLTDNRETLKFRAKSSIILNRLDEFQRQLLERMSGVKPPAAPVAATATAVANTAEKAVNAVADKASAPTSKSSKKKKGKKK
ncbi:signal recognition particle protein [Malassezia pachydermatis]|uniref:Signal recognition particle 9 protein n=1 Tax=Malassezia pachydermatis TaxID=77020 RepID=A0A0M8MT48_9BASI|nr:signal recognition particle 9 protein [Malassezia pachydermatis]KOS16227.1 signal recognition particle 9 protein [Malassezia pachydermatis]